jgi:hypothetical protein
MKEALVDYDTAVLAKQKGFDWECRYYYHPDKPEKARGWFGELNTNGMTYWEDDKKVPKKEISAPTQSVLQKWLRDVHKLETGLKYWDNDKYSYEVMKIFNGKMLHLNRMVFIGDYEKTLEKALVESLKQID